MGKFNNILIVSDIDGTFMGKGGRLVERNVEKIKYFISEGGLFTFATGRTFQDVRNLIPTLGELVNAPAILVNGTYFYDFEKQERSDEEFADADVIRSIIKYVKKNYPGIEYRVATRSGHITDNADGPRLSREYARAAEGSYHVYPSGELPGNDWYKCVFRADAKDNLRLRADIEPKYCDVFTFFFSHPEIFELQKKGTSKGVKLKKLKKMYHDAGKELTAFAAGDFENDIEMLEAADVAVCPTNAMDKVKAIADVSPCDNDEGLIAALIEIIEDKYLK